MLISDLLYLFIYLFTYIFIFRSQFLLFIFRVYILLLCIALHCFYICTLLCIALHAPAQALSYALHHILLHMCFYMHWMPLHIISFSFYWHKGASWHLGSSSTQIVIRISFSTQSKHCPSSLSGVYIVKLLSCQLWMFYQ